VQRWTVTSEVDVKEPTKQIGCSARESPRSLPLFSDEPSLGDRIRSKASAQNVSARRGRAWTRPPADRHLSAARRLAREIRRTAPGSPEQVMTGQRICRHLIAMLQEPIAPSRRAPHGS
jgi:hypothetical protein